MGTLIARFLPSLIPGLGAFANPWVLLAVAAAAGLIFFKGYQYGRGALDDYIGKQAVEAVRIITKRGEVTEKIVTRYIKVKGETQVVEKTIEKEVIRYVDANLDRFPLSRGAVVLHDSAAANTVPDTALSTDGTASGVEAAALVKTASENYAEYHKTADRMRALQAWVLEQQAVK